MPDTKKKKDTMGSYDYVGPRKKRSEEANAKEANAKKEADAKKG